MKQGYPLLLLVAWVGCSGSASEQPLSSRTEPALAVGVDAPPAERTNAADTNSAPALADTPANPPPSDAPAGAASRGASNSVMEVTFEDIQLPVQPDMVFRPFMLSERVKELDGRKIRIHGYMLPDTKTKGITQFVLLKNTECKFGPGGQIDHLINVLMIDGVTAKFRDKPVSVQGVLKINPFQGPDGNTWSIYDLACERVEAYRPRR